MPELAASHSWALPAKILDEEGPFADELSSRLGEVTR